MGLSTKDQNTLDKIKKCVQKNKKILETTRVTTIISDDTTMQDIELAMIEGLISGNIDVNDIQMILKCLGNLNVELSMNKVLEQIKTNAMFVAKWTIIDEKSDCFYVRNKAKPDLYFLISNADSSTIEDIDCPILSLEFINKQGIIDKEFDTLYYKNINDIIEELNQY